MRAHLSLLLAAACVAFLAGEALAGCAKATWGKTNTENGDKKHILDTVVVPDVKGKSNITATIKFDKIPDCETVGVSATFCEANRLRFTADFEVNALLLGSDSFADKALLSSTVYCTPHIALKH